MTAKCTKDVLGRTGVVQLLQVLYFFRSETFTTFSRNPNVKKEASRISKVKKIILNTKKVEI